jgi:hypothetical protein
MYFAKECLRGDVATQKWSKIVFVLATISGSKTSSSSAYQNCHRRMNRCRIGSIRRFIRWPSHFESSLCTTVFRSSDEPKPSFVDQGFIQCYWKTWRHKLAAQSSGTSGACLYTRTLIIWWFDRRCVFPIVGSSGAYLQRDPTCLNGSRLSLLSHSFKRRTPLPRTRAPPPATTARTPPVPIATGLQTSLPTFSAATLLLL